MMSEPVRILIKEDPYSSDSSDSVDSSYNDSNMEALIEYYHNIVEETKKEIEKQRASLASSHKIKE